MRIPASLQARHRRALKQSENYANRHTWQYFASIAVGISLFFATGLGRGVINAIDAQGGDGPMSVIDLGIALLGSAIGGGILGILLFFLALYVYYWRKP